MKHFFIQILNFVWAWADNFGVFSVFSANLSAPILDLWVPCPCLPLINNYLFKKLSLYIQMPNIFLGVGFEFWPQRIRDLAIAWVRSPWPKIYDYAKFFTYVTKTLAQLSTYSRKTGNYNGTIIFEIDSMKKFSPLNLKFTFYAISKPK